MNIEETAAIMDALAHPTRIKIFHALKIAGEDGLNTGQLGFVVDCPASTMAHHIKIMIKSGLISQHRTGRQVCLMVDHSLAEQALKTALSV